MAAFPCSICEDSFKSPKELANHILQQHCETEKLEEKVEVDGAKTIVMDVDPLEHGVKKEISQEELDLDDTILPVLPRAPTGEEQKQKFLMYSLPEDPANFMR